jgi:hypothetical protein
MFRCYIVAEEAGSAFVCVCCLEWVKAGNISYISGKTKTNPARSMIDIDIHYDGHLIMVSLLCPALRRERTACFGP